VDCGEGHFRLIVSMTKVSRQLYARSSATAL
jgi:hypothetical protein